MTAQIGNSITIGEVRRALLSRPEAGFLARLDRLPGFCARSTANWCGYKTEWAVVADKLYLLGLDGLVCDRLPNPEVQSSAWCRVGHLGDCLYREISLSDLCPVPSGGIPALWFTGELRIPDGELVEYVHAGWASGYERDLIVEVVAGQVVSEKIVRIPAISPPRASPRGSLWKRLWRGFQ